MIAMTHLVAPLHIHDALILRSALRRELFAASLTVTRGEAELEDLRLTHAAAEKVAQSERRLAARRGWHRRCAALLEQHEARYFPPPVRP